MPRYSARSRAIRAFLRCRAKAAYRARSLLRGRRRALRALAPMLMAFAGAAPAMVPVSAAVGAAEPGPASVVNAFDLAVQGALPAVVVLPGAAAEGERAVFRPAQAARIRRATPDPELVVTRALNAWVDIPGMPEGRMYLGTYGGREAALTRIGDHLDISLSTKDGVEVIGYTSGNPDIFHETQRNPVPRPRDDSHVAPNLPYLDRRRRAIEDPLAYSPTFYVFIHDDVRKAPRPVHAVFGAIWLANLASRVFPAETIRISYLLGVPGVTDLPYGYPEALENWQNTVAAWSAQEGMAHGKTYKHKFALLTRDPPMPGALGVAYEGGAEGIASTSGRATILAHEFGHMWGATHADAERVHASWWWCATHMYPAPSDLLTDCDRFSSQNERNMRSYLHHGPDPETLAERRTSVTD